VCHRQAVASNTLESHQSCESLLTRKQVAELLGVCTESVKRRERAGLLSAIRLGCRITRYRRADVEKLISRSEYRSDTN
jgi:predicted site-specific integrase-resolvase